MGDIASTGSLRFDTREAVRSVPIAVLVSYKVEPFIALIAAILMSPVGAAVAFLIVLLSRRSPLVRHRRVGWRGEELQLLKFRTMWSSEPDEARFSMVEDLPDVHPAIKRRTDERVTSAFAAWCRRYSLDELPQLVHIIRGEMSFVGPRPITRTELDTYYGRHKTEVLSLRPGLTGLWQVMGRNTLTYPQRRRLDLLLVRRASPRLFLAILLKSIPCVIRGHGAY